MLDYIRGVESGSHGREYPAALISTPNADGGKRQYGESIGEYVAGEILTNVPGVNTHDTTLALALGLA